MDRQRLEAEVKRVQIQSELTAAVQTIAKLRQETERLQSDMDDWRDRHDAREAELNALRSAVGLPWWRRLLPMKEG
jgi:phage host-nuclease inhibitor protein Gam